MVRCYLQKENFLDVEDTIERRTAIANPMVYPILFPYGKIGFDMFIEPVAEDEQPSKPIKKMIGMDKI